MAKIVPNSEATRFKTGSEQAEIAKKGGIASGIARKEKKMFREAIEKKLGKSIDEIIDAYINKAKDGDIQAGVFLRDTIGEKPTDKVEANVSNTTNPYANLTDEELKKLAGE